MTSRRVIGTADDRIRWNAFQDNAEMPYTVTFAPGAGRTNSQNSLLHKWFTEISVQVGDSTMTDIKGQCHRKYGLAIKLRDAQFAWVWQRSGAGLTYDQQCSLLASGVLNVSSSMTVKELTEYMGAMGKDYREQGYTLTDPQIMKYEDVNNGV